MKLANKGTLPASTDCMASGGECFALKQAHGKGAQQRPKKYFREAGELYLPILG